MRDSSLVKKPWITEKSARLNEGGKYVFLVKDGATKNEVKKLVKDLYHVDVVEVNMINIPSKSRRYRGLKSTKVGYKKAITTLKSGQKIDLAR
ncbi:MAG: 50S ribosomal protein L23 [Candidatus Liptonbacteria bacterium]